LIRLLRRVCGAVEVARRLAALEPDDPDVRALVDRASIR
jgi:hypothetical protein